MYIDEKELSKKNEYKRIIYSYPGEQRYVLVILQDLQKNFNYIPRLGLQMVAEHAGVPVSKVYSMASFYKALSLSPKGRVAIKVCDGTACHIKSGPVLVDQVYKYLHIKPGETSADGEFSLETVNCLGACALAPVMVVNGKVYGKLTPSSIAGIIKEYGGGTDESSLKE
ncbi:MAG: NAD(P)H-dependent oxidoreductase subunit E [Bacillota bacterium]|nr:NAD(P)H-dependent oxidoreductase subunit E [Bacillota bacterium]